MRSHTHIYVSTLLDAYYYVFRLCKLTFFPEYHYKP